jgi:hypothetical protein
LEAGPRGFPARSAPHIWAPDVWRDPDTGRFYLYYTANKTVGVAEAAGPEGPFVITRKLVDQAIDAHLFRDDDGRLYLYYVTLPGFRITVQPMASPTEPAGDARVILRPESEWETRNGRVTEGPWMIKHDGRTICCTAVRAPTPRLRRRLCHQFQSTRAVHPRRSQSDLASRRRRLTVPDTAARSRTPRARGGSSITRRTATGAPGTGSSASTGCTSTNKAV